MIKGVEYYGYFQTLDSKRKAIFLLSNFPQWYKFDYDKRELAFNAPAFAQWYSSTNIIEQDLWFKALPIEDQKAVIKLWAIELASKPITFSYSNKDQDPDKRGNNLNAKETTQKTVTDSRQSIK